MREVVADQERELTRLSKEWRDVLDEVRRFNEAARKSGTPALEAP
jgi:hypothetical protein